MESLFYKILSYSKVNFITIGEHNLGLSIQQTLENGTRIIQGRFSFNELSEQHGLPEFSTISTKYQGDVEKWNLSKDEMRFCLEKARDIAFKHLTKAACEIDERIPKRGQYFIINNHFSNFLKEFNLVDDNTISISYGTEKKEHYVLYHGLFILVQYVDSYDLFCFGVKSTDKRDEEQINDLLENRDIYLHHCFQYDPRLKIHESYR